MKHPLSFSILDPRKRFPSAAIFAGLLLILAGCQSGGNSGGHGGIDSSHSGFHHDSAFHKHSEGGDANSFMAKKDFEDLVRHFEDPERESWQKPKEVVELFGDLRGKTILDIGAGTGYFSFPLAQAGARVIAGDVDDRFLDYIRNKMKETGVGENQIEPRKLPYDSPDLADDEVDFVIIVNTYHHIENREAYFAKVRKGLKKGGVLMVVDFKLEESPVGPPLSMRIGPDQIRDELTAAGFEQFSLDETDLKYQYIVMVR